MKKLTVIMIVLLFVSRIVTGQIPKGATEVIFLHVNDMHAKIDNMRKLAYLADSLRKINKHLFLVAAGDNFTGNPVVDMVEDKGYPMIDLMNLCGFSLSTFGNHEFDLGQEMLNRRLAQATFPFISCNFETSGSVLKQPKPFVILKAGKAKIPVLGIVQLGPNGLPDSHPSKLSSLKFTDGLVKALEYKNLKRKYGVLVALTHLGIEGDVPLAQVMPEFDLIIGGHSHTTMKEPLTENGVMIVQTGNWLSNVGKTTLIVHKKKIIDKKYELIAMSSISKSKSEVVEKIKFYNSNEELNRVIAKAVSSFENKTKLGYLMSDAITSQLKTDFAFQNLGGIRIPDLPQGDIKYNDVYRLDPFGNQVVIYKMNLSEIKLLILNAFNREKSIDLIPSGLKYNVKTDATGKCIEVDLTDMEGKALTGDNFFTVGINSYIAASYKFDHTDEGIAQPFTTAETLINYLKEKKEISQTEMIRFKVN